MIRRWETVFTDTTSDWLLTEKEDVRESIIAYLNVLEEKGPNLGRPYADTLEGSKYPNLKELRVQHNGEPYRLFYIFNKYREAVILCGASKKGLNEKDFYKKMIKIAEKEYEKEVEMYGLE